MSDYELYGDYNEIDEPPKKHGVGFVIKLVAIILCFTVVAFIGFRLFTFNYYPRSVKRIHFTPELTAYYNACGGDIGALTQSLRAPYDDEREGNFFCDNLIVIKGAGEIQLSLRYNSSLPDKLGVDFDNEDITFTLRRSGGAEDATGYEAGRLLDAELTVCRFEEFMMYRYAKLVFDGIDFGEDGSDIEWIRLDIEIAGVERDEPFMVCIYEDNAAFSRFSEYKLSAEERPQ